MAIKKIIKRLFPVEWTPPPYPFRAALAASGYFRLRTWLAAHGQRVPQHDLYRPLYCPWDGDPAFARVYGPARKLTMISPDRCHVLWQSLQQAAQLGAGDFIECGVYRGGSALLASLTLQGASPSLGERGAALRLVDTFAGMPDGGPRAAGERWDTGDLAGTSVDAVRKLLSAFPFVRVHQGCIPDVFANVDSPSFAWAHVDVDMGVSIRDSIEFVYPRLVSGGIMVFDDYGRPSCVQSRVAVDEAFAHRPEVPIYLPTGQCLVIKLPPSKNGASP